MILNIFLHCALLFTLTQSENATLLRSTHDGNISTVSKGSKLDSHNKTEIPLVSEGGNILPNGPDISLPQQQQKLTSLLSLDEELSKTKEKAVVPRKGVDNFIPDNIADGVAGSENNKTVVFASERSNTTMKSSSTIPSESNKTHSPLLNKTETNLNETKVHKKPTILSYEALVNLEKNIQSSQPKIPVVPSVKTAASSQIPSPNEAPVVKVYPSKANNNHPGMIMPIVITILVVPMFAIVGYMALKRGQEAWKNRHYKRMDFLLDGMYND